MAEQITIKKTIYSLQGFNNLINSNFTQLTKTGKTLNVRPDMTIEQFFNEYNILFYDIPQDGEKSHLDLATRSLEYLGISLEDLQNEITELRQENINLKTQILVSSKIKIGTQL